MGVFADLNLQNRGSCEADSLRHERQDLGERG